MGSCGCSVERAHARCQLARGASPPGSGECWVTSSIGRAPARCIRARLDPSASRHARGGCEDAVRLRAGATSHYNEADGKSVSRSRGMVLAPPYLTRTTNIN